MIYEVETFKLIGLTIFLYQEVDYLELVKEKNMPERLINTRVNKPVVKHPRRFYVSDLKEIQGKDIQVLNREESSDKLPYFADVTSDIPGYLNIEPDTYKSCQLMAETHGGYLQFFDNKTEKILRIAINSNTYSPLKSK